MRNVFAVALVALSLSGCLVDNLGDGDGVDAGEVEPDVDAEPVECEPVAVPAWRLAECEVVCDGPSLCPDTGVPQPAPWDAMCRGQCAAAWSDPSVVDNAGSAYCPGL